MIIEATELNYREICVLIGSIEIFSAEEKGVARELLDEAVKHEGRGDYQFYAYREESGILSAFICYGPTPMTEGTYDLYWIATDPSFTRRGRARALVAFMIYQLSKCAGRLIRVETSSQESYEGTAAFYRSISFVEDARIRDFYKNKDDLVIFTRKVVAKNAI